MTSDTEDKPLPKEDMLSFLKRKGRFYELILCAWDNLEFNVDQIVAAQFGLHDDGSKKTQFVLDTSFGRKLAFLKDVGAMTIDEYHKIEQFQKRRNILVHSEGWSEAFVMSENERRKVMDEAMEAAGVSFDVLFRP